MMKIRDDPACPGENPIYIASISKGSVVEGKLKVKIIIMIIMVDNNGGEQAQGEDRPSDTTITMK